MINNNSIKSKYSQKEMRNSYLDDEFYSFYTEEARISVKKVREIGLRSFSLSGNIVSLKRNNLVSFESSLERDFINSLEFDKSIKTYYEQPLKIFYTLDSVKRYYVPDFYVIYNDNRKDEVIEIKYKYDLEKNKKKLKYKFNAAREFCKFNNLIFRVVDEIEVRNDFMENSKFLLPYKRIKQDINFQDVENLEERLRVLKKSTPSELILKSNIREDRKAELLYVLWFMIANDLINTNLKVKLTMNSQIWI